MARAVLFDRHPLERIVRWRTVANVLSTGFDVRRCFQCSAGCALGPRVLALRQLVQNIGGLVHPTALTAGLWPNLLERLPEPECTVGNRELGTDRKPPSSQIEEHFLPGLCALADTVG